MRVRMAGVYGWLHIDGVSRDSLLRLYNAVRVLSTIQKERSSQSWHRPAAAAGLEEFSI
jgi:hypothetical protein